MNPPTPADLIWEPITPVLGALDQMSGFIDLCGAYVLESACISVGAALLMLTGAVFYSQTAERSAPDVISTPQVPSMS